MLWLILSQCRDLGMGVIWEDLRVLITVRAVQDSSESVLEAIYLGLRKIVVESYSSQVWSEQ